MGPAKGAMGKMSRRFVEQHCLGVIELADLGGEDARPSTGHTQHSTTATGMFTSSCESMPIIAYQLVFTDEALGYIIRDSALSPHSTFELSLDADLYLDHLLLFLARTHTIYITMSC